MFSPNKARRQRGHLSQNARVGDSEEAATNGFLGVGVFPGGDVFGLVAAWALVSAGFEVSCAIEVGFSFLLGKVVFLAISVMEVQYQHRVISSFFHLPRSLAFSTGVPDGSATTPRVAAYAHPCVYRVTIVAVVGEMSWTKSNALGAGRTCVAPVIAAARRAM